MGDCPPAENLERLLCEELNVPLRTQIEAHVGQTAPASPKPIGRVDSRVLKIPRDFRRRDLNRLP
jgi:hypothetical protein